MSRSRIQHFECLNLNRHDRARAAHAVLHGVAFDRKFEDMASADLERLGLAANGTKDGKSNFDCVHVRRGDFKQFAPQYWLEDNQLSEKLKSMFSGKPVLVASDSRPELDLGTRVVHS